ncbi:peptide chain release factor 1-like, mitochondrial [Pseudomyrmex gracilis]|uniref:peptide chain release factor 1-like, mitochondrial n=1 Tax=Pseudomyrmex gracilis TaxID=219809 RepID=UPI0009952B04|nr:peptide chain release factor 1-like, mitochondrial [Pseudomyrmex gracilis]
MSLKNMSLLIRKCRFNKYWKCGDFVNLSRIHELHVSSATRLKLTRHLCGTHASPQILNDKVRRCLDYLGNEYKSGSWENINDLGLIDLSASSNLLSKRVQLVENIRDLQELAKEDTEMKKLATEEENLYKEQLKELDEKLLNVMLTYICKEPCNSILIEITAGVGGQEAMLFVKDLYNMYINYAKYLGLNHDVIDLETTDNNGIRHATIMVSGDQAFKFRHEGGVHRVQRVPATERSGRMHTSTATVAVLPAPSEVEIAINPKDLRIETKRASGAGGQHVNTTDSAIRITHVPSGQVVTCQIHRSQIKNKETAMTKLRSVLYQQQLNQQTSVISKQRREQMGMGLRNEKIRTYNYNQDRVTDHRLQNGTLHNLTEFMQGGAALEDLEIRLHKEIQIKTLLDVIKKLEI